MKNGTLYETRIDLCFSSVIGDKIYLHRDEMVIFIELVKKNNMKMLYFLHKNQLIRHDISLEFDESQCFEAWFK